MLKAAISLLIAVQALGPLATDDLKQQANDLAYAAITVAQYQITHPDMTDNDTSTGGGTSNGGAAAPEETTTPEPQGPATIEVIATDNSQELGDTFEVATGEANLSNTVFLGAIVRDSEGNNVRDAQMTISVDGEVVQEQNGTGNVHGGIYYHPFSYTFLKAGDHVFTFSALGVQQEVTLTAAE